MKKIILSPLFALSVLAVLFTAAPVAFAEQGASCTAQPGNQAGTLDADGNCVATEVGPPAPPPTQSGFVPLAPIPGLTEGGAAEANGFADFFNNVYKYLIGLAAAFAVIEIIWGGLEISTKDSVSKQSDGRNRITQAIFGLILVLSPVLVFSIINPSILNLSISIPPLDVIAPPPLRPNEEVEDEETGCVVSGIRGILQIATCPSLAAARTWTESCLPDDLTGVSLLSAAQGQEDGSSFAICNGVKEYLFIETVSGLTIDPEDEIDPVVSTATNVNNGTEVMSFLDICRANDRTTCISNDPFYIIFDEPCPEGLVTQISESGGGSKKCYLEKLTCVLSPSLIEGRKLCDEAPDWEIFD